VEFGRYRLTGIVGSGGMGRVFRAELLGESGFRKVVAIKVVRADPDAGDGRIEEFRREARVGGLLRHPNVVDVYDFGVTDERPWIAMELVEGRSLAQLLRDGPLPALPALDCALQMAEGLTHAHGLEQDGEPVELVHRDLKPANVLVTPQGQVKITDFGVARASGARGDLTQTGGVRGTPAYMSPEQARGEHVDARSDLFSLGLVLLELLTGRMLLQRSNVLAVMMALLEVETLLEEALPEAEAVCPGVGEVLRRLVRVDPGQRFPRASAAGGALRELASRTAGRTLRQHLESDGEEPATLRQAPAAFSAIFGSHGGSTRPSAALARRTNLAPDASSFVGRSADLDHVDASFEAGVRLVTLLGPGGTGKTRLSRRHASSRLSELLPHGGVWFLDLSEARTQDGMLQVVSSTLGVPLDRAGAAADQLGHALADRGPMLLVLDNVEQIAREAAAVLSRWLDLAPDAQFLVTSRERLRLGAERVIELGPLSDDEAIALFEDRAAAARQGFVLTEADRPVVAEIVTALDRLPLAIELAAARVAVLPPRRIRDRLDQRFRLLSRGARGDRQATLRGTIQWSWDLLEPAEQAAFAQCASFRGGFSLEDAELVLDLDEFEDAPWPLDVVQALRDKSLIHAWQPPGLGGELRFGLYESLRVFAAEQLALRDETAAFDRHADAILQRCQELVDRVNGTDGRYARRSLALELDNLAAVLERFETTRPELAVRAAQAMAEGLKTSGTSSLMRGLLDRAVDAAERFDDNPSRIAALLARTRFAMDQTRPADAGADLALAARLAVSESAAWRARVAVAQASRASETGAYPEAHEFAERGWQAAMESNDPRIEVLAIRARAQAVGYAGDEAGSVALHTECLTRFRALGDRRGQAMELNALAVVSGNAGRLEEAEERFREALSLYREIGHVQGVGVLQVNLGLVALQRGELEDAERRLRRAVELHRNLGFRKYQGGALCSLGCIETVTGRLDDAAASFAESERLLRTLGPNWYLTIAQRDRALLGIIRDEPAAARAAAERAMEMVSSHPDHPYCAVTRAIYAAVLAFVGDAEAGPQAAQASQQVGVHDPADVAFCALARAPVRLTAEPAAPRDELAGLCARFGYDDDEPRHHDSTLQLMQLSLAARLSR